MWGLQKSLGAAVAPLVKTMFLFSPSTALHSNITMQTKFDKKLSIAIYSHKYVLDTCFNLHFFDLL
jgi:hypothetical protein